MMSIAVGFLIPLIGTVLGSACVYLMSDSFNRSLQRVLTGFAAGVMTAASVWSLLIPAIEQSSAMGHWAFLPAAAGFWIGTLFLLMLDRIIPHLHMYSSVLEGRRSGLSGNVMLLLAVTLHNIPEGMAVGAVYAGLAGGAAGMTPEAAMALSLGIAIQNLPEGAVISMPLRANGLGRHRAFLYGAASGAVEPAGALFTFWAAQLVVPAMPVFLSFAAGAMIYVVVEELIPEMSSGEHSNVGVLSFAAGFSLMMALDVLFA